MRNTYWTGPNGRMILKAIPATPRDGNARREGEDDDDDDHSVHGYIVGAKCFSFV